MTTFTPGLYKFLAPMMAPFATAHFLRKQEAGEKSAECNDQTMNEAEALQKIMSEGEGSMDPQEMMELMAQQRNDLKPFPFEKLMQNTAMFKQHEALDGLNMNLSLPLGQNFQLGANWLMSNTKGANFELSTALNNVSPSIQRQEDVSQVQLRYNSDNSASIMGVF
jgi:hypothetical protein